MIRIRRIVGPWGEDTFEITWQDGKTEIIDEVAARRIAGRNAVQFPEKKPRAYYDLVEKETGLNLDDLIGALQNAGFPITGMHIGEKGEKGFLFLANKALNPDEKKSIREILDQFGMKHAYVSSKGTNLTIEFPIE